MEVSVKVRLSNLMVAYLCDRYIGSLELACQVDEEDALMLGYRD